MAYDRHLADRVRALVGYRPDVAERRMFGGLAWLLDGVMAVVARSEGGLMVRLDPGEAEAALDLPGTEPVVMRGRVMRGWVAVPQPGGDLAGWVQRGLDYANTLPPKHM